MQADLPPMTHAAPLTHAASIAERFVGSLRLSDLTKAGSRPAARARPGSTLPESRRSTNVRAASRGWSAWNSTPPTSSKSFTAGCEKAFATEECRAIKEPIEPSARWLAKMEAGHTSAASRAATRVKGASGLTVEELIKQTV